MIGYFVKAGDLDADAAFSPYSAFFGKLLDHTLEHSEYGHDLKLILVQYHLEGKFLQLPPKQYRVMPYRKKEQALSVIVGVPRRFADKPEMERRRFVIQTTMEAVNLVRAKMNRLGYKDINFDRLNEAVQECAREFLAKGEDEIRTAWRG